MVGRPYDEDRDLGAITRMWREVGWIDDTDEQADALRRVAARGGGIVADVRGEAECLVLRTPGTVRYLDTDLPLCAISGVTTSHIGRRQGLASALMVEALTAAVEEGAAVAGLGFFEQGYYDRFGFGTSCYEHRLRFDPASLDVPVPHRPPVRLGVGEMEELHALMARRHRGHGSVVLDPVDWFAVEWAWLDKPFALGWRGDDGRLTHALLGTMKDGHGPYVIEQLAYEELPQLLDLLGWLRVLGEQVNQVEIAAEPADVQLQDLGGWPGIGGSHTVHLGRTSSVQDGIADGLPVLDASVGAFTRLWFGVRPATSLAITDDLAGPDDLLGQLDRSLRLPTPQAGWPY